MTSHKNMPVIFLLLKGLKILKLIRKDLRRRTDLSARLAAFRSTVTGLQLNRP